MGTPVQMKWIAVVKINKEKEVQHVCPDLKISITLRLSIGWFQKMKLKCLKVKNNHRSKFSNLNNWKEEA